MKSQVRGGGRKQATPKAKFKLKKVKAMVDLFEKQVTKSEGQREPLSGEPKLQPGMPLKARNNPFLCSQTVSTNQDHQKNTNNKLASKHPAATASDWPEESRKIVATNPGAKTGKALENWTF